MRIETQVQPATSPKRPRSVAILAWLQLIQSLSLLGLGIYLFAVEGIPDSAARASHFLPLAVFDNMISSALMVLLGVLGLVTSFALLRLRSWAWMAAMILQGFGLLAALIGYIRQEPNYVGMVTSIILVLYLNQHEVQTAFREKRDGEHHETL